MSEWTETLEDAQRDRDHWRQRAKDAEGIIRQQLEAARHRRETGLMEFECDGLATIGGVQWHRIIVSGKLIAAGGPDR